jgi:hypothetical protein
VIMRFHRTKRTVISRCLYSCWLTWDCSWSRVLQDHRSTLQDKHTNQDFDREPFMVQDQDRWNPTRGLDLALEAQHLRIMTGSSMISPPAKTSTTW